MRGLRYLLVLAALLSAETLFIAAPGGALAQRPSPRTCDAARRQGVILPNCPRPRPRPSPPRPRPAPSPPAPRPEPPVANETPPPALFGNWSGIILEPRSLRRPEYRIAVRIERDRNGQPVGIARYDDFPCTGVWSNGVRHGSIWRFDETITEGGPPLCANNVIIEIELTPDDFISVRLYPNGYENMPSRGTLHRAY